MPTAMICGISGQDGSYLAELLLAKGYRVVGTSRDVDLASFANLSRLGIRDRVELLSMAPNDFRSTLAAVSRAEPDEIYGLAGQSSVGLSFDMPVETLESIVFGTLNLLEAIRLARPGARFYHASSSECYGDLRNSRATESTPFHPRSPYGVAKTSSHLLVASYREAYGLFAANGILFNHESPLRPERFVTRKVTAAAARIARGESQRLTLGRLDVVRDWGWAPEYVEAMWRILQHGHADDFIIATGQSQSLEHFVAAAFASVGLDWREHVDVDPKLVRPSELAWSSADPAKAAHELGWRAEVTMPEVAARMTSSEPDRPAG
jgi:GDPmannose 4,6-dehydratase